MHISLGVAVQRLGGITVMKQIYNPLFATSQNVLRPIILYQPE